MEEAFVDILICVLVVFLQLTRGEKVFAANCLEHY